MIQASPLETAERSAPEVLDLPVLSPESAAEAVEAVLALKPHWTPRHPLAPFFTLGAAAYLDAVRGLDAYAALARRTNPLLEERFAGLYEHLAVVLEETLGEPVAVTRRLALPGFHVYEPFFAFAGSVASLHWDRQQVLLPWPESRVPEAVLSLTLPLSVPTGRGQDGGCGLDLWAWRYPSEAETRTAVLRDPGRPERTLDYRAGSAILHDGQNLHRARLMPTDEAAGNEPAGNGAAGEPRPRVTLQAHLAWSARRWELYW